MNPKTQLSQLTGIGPGFLYKLQRLNLNTVEDLIYYFPFRYDDFSNTTSALNAKIGGRVTLQGEIWSIRNIFTRSRKIITKAIFNDGSAPLELIWFHSSWLTKQIKTGDRLQISGKLLKYKNKLSIIMPTWEKLSEVGSYLTPGVKQILTPGVKLHTGRLVPIYPETTGISSKWLRTKINQFLPQILDKIADPLPNEIRNNMLPLSNAIQQIHFPNNWQEAEKARERLGFDELFYVSLATQKARSEWSKKPPVKPLKINPADVKNFIGKLPFKLTAAQERVLEEILVDLKKNQPMNRLIQGEVGSGKTVVAAIIIYLIHLNGLKTLFMAPTEILAFQHFETLKKFLEPFGISVGIYTGSKKFTKHSPGRSQGPPSRWPNGLLEGEIPNVIIGTHALLSQKLSIDNVGLVIVDEQQRFGVEQRTLLRNRAKIPHFLTMTATPIPRTVALTLYGDLDMSVIDELPKGRQRVKTYLVPEKKRSDSHKFIAKKVAQGDQVYIITPLIEASETLLSVKAAKVEFDKLKVIFPKFNLDLLHGRMKGALKEKVTNDFRSGKTQILVSTSVVEVGMDNPNAAIIIIEGAERFGLAQLHQLRGRVGRGTKESFCLLYTSGVGSSPNYVSSNNSQRLKYLETTFDGLKLAELDLKIRGGGQIFGVLQAGRFDFKIASFSNISLLEQTKDAARKLLAEDPALDKYLLLKAKLQDITRAVMPD